MGGGGLYSTGRDYLRFLRMLLHGGRLGEVQVLRPETVAEMPRNQIGDLTVGALKIAMPTASNDVELFPGMVKKWGLGFLITTEALPTGRSAGSLAWCPPRRRRSSAPRPSPRCSTATGASGTGRRWSPPAG
jgi:methyl acetate hydrolase